jgi:hypothetical protein
MNRQRHIVGPDIIIDMRRVLLGAGFPVAESPCPARDFSGGCGLVREIDRGTGGSAQGVPGECGFGSQTDPQAQQSIVEVLQRISSPVNTLMYMAISSRVPLKKKNGAEGS